MLISMIPFWCPHFLKSLLLMLPHLIFPATHQKKHYSTNKFIRIYNGVKGRLNMNNCDMFDTFTSP